MGCVKLHILDQHYKQTELKVSYIKKELTLNNRVQNARRYLFTGYERDNESGLDYAGARYYDSKITFPYSPDKKWYLSPHHSPYVWNNNNPIKYIDPDGNYSVTPLPDEYFADIINKNIGVPFVNGLNFFVNKVRRIADSFKIQIGVSAGVGLGFKATKYCQFRGELELAGADLTLNTGQAKISALKAEGKVEIGNKGGLNFKGTFSVADVDFNNVQNVFKLETPDFNKFNFVSVEGKAQFAKLFEASGSAWAIQNSKGEWSFLDGKTNIGIKRDVFEKTDVQAEIKLGVKVKIGIDFKQLFNIEENK